MKHKQSKVAGMRGGGEEIKIKMLYYNLYLMGIQILKIKIMWRRIQHHDILILMRKNQHLTYSVPKCEFEYT